MTHSIFDSGNLVVSFDDERVARDALDRLATEEPDHSGAMILVAFDDTGSIVNVSAPADPAKT